MKVLPLGTATLPAGTDLYRIQRPLPASAGARGHVIGGVHLPPIPGLRGRFDLAATHVAAFALDARTAVYETFARSTAQAVSLSLLGARELLTVQTTVDLHLCDVRPHPFSFPFLTAARYGATQAEADEADRVHNLYGVLYSSAQRQGAQCVALFDKVLPGGQAVLGTLSGGSSAPLVSRGRLHPAVVGALVGSQLPLVP